ncbi:MAG: preprotein translocase subunit SecE [bacterium]|nr:preprotein translocase subunit SecE [bacterium]MDA1024749.1 preprotein translocase subunit SecE [bacterium]
MKLANVPAVKYFIEAKQEMEKVTWPTQKEVIKYSIIVAVSALAAGIYFGVLDFVIQLGLKGLLSL